MIVEVRRMQERAVMAKSFAFLRYGNMKVLILLKKMH
jgi:hypothetical protein